MPQHGTMQPPIWSGYTLCDMPAARQPV